MEVWKTTRTVVAAILLLALFTSRQTCITGLTTSPPLPMLMTTSPSPAAPRYKFNLDLPDEERWVSILRHYDKDNLKQMIKHALSTQIPKEAFPLVDLIGSQLNKYMPDPYAGEIRSIANWLDVSVGEIFAMNIIYEATAFCTSIVAVDNNNMVWHGRNLDYSFPDILRNVTVILDFQRNNRTVFTSTSYVGNVGIFTGMKPNVFTVSINERDKGNVYENIIGILSALRKSDSDYFVSFLAREALEYDDSFDAAYRRLNNTRIIAPVYYIIGGVKPDEGVIITRSRFRSLDINPLIPKMDKWFALETNYDRWTTPPPSDDRRDPAIDAMNAVGRKNINDKTMYEVLSVPPVLNYKTVYTTLMSAARPDLFQTYIRHSP
ncbi:N-acylethanolamine-hydrolyzing acid amidase-like [Anneissia japonica]|uniref:N-acylethanolamine-hydrolyzing acid amidase-like n=1 Tax=Anneissia japonica TaxID=1529436 RepID=UPI00142587B2|nr:N-acylethanolamine-hydrolyzing acid amidase-like [Anneissia japonica]